MDVGPTELKVCKVMGRLIAIRAAAWGEDSERQRRFLHVDDGGMAAAAMAALVATAAQG
jgi:hypothetical protein